MTQYISVLEGGEALLSLIRGYIQCYESAPDKLPESVHCSPIYEGRNVLYRLKIEEGDFVVKHFGPLSSLRQLYYGWTKSGKARRSYLHALALESLELFTPDALGAIEEYNRWGKLIDSYYVCHWVPFDEPHLHHFASYAHTDPTLISDLGKALAEMHECGVYHEDLSPGNLPAVRDPETGHYSFALVDLNRMTFYPYPLAEELSVRNLQRLLWHPLATQALAVAYTEARSWPLQPFEANLQRRCDAFWRHRLPKLSRRLAKRQKGLSALQFLRLFGRYRLVCRLRHLCPVASWRESLKGYEQRFYNEYLAEEDLRRAWARHEGYEYTPLRGLE